MQFIPQQWSIEESAIPWRDLLAYPVNPWETTKDKMEECGFSTDGYCMINKSKWRWMYYKNELPYDASADYILDASIQLMSKETYGHFGLCWGFGNSIETLNRFTVSADKERCTIMQFQKDHIKSYHRFQQILSSPKTDLFCFSILKLQSYFYFFLNGDLMYLAHKSHFAEQGNQIGFYVEPELHVIGKSFRIGKLTAASVNASPKFFNELFAS